MPAAKPQETKLQLNVKSGGRDGDLLNVYASNANELKALVEDLVTTAPSIAARFGLTSKNVGADGATQDGGATVEGQSAASTAAPAPAAGADGSGPAASTTAEVVPPKNEAVAAPAPTSGESPRDKALKRLRGEA